MQVGLLLRRGWRATLFLALLAGLAGGIAMAAWSLGRQASSAFDRLLTYSDPSDLMLNLCPPDVETVNEETQPRCASYDAADEVATARQLPEVETAGRAVYAGLTASLQGDPNRTWPSIALVMLDPPASLDGAPIVVAGRRPDPAAADEVAVNERFAELTGATVGDELDLTFWGPDELGAVAAEGEIFNGPRLTVRIVGIERSVLDLLAVVGTSASAIDEMRVSAGPGLAASIRDVPRFSAVAVVATDGDRAAAEAAVEQAFAGRFYLLTPYLAADEQEPIAEAIRYEAGGTMLFGAITALAAVVFAGQAVSRQSRREWADGPTLRALGMSDRDATASALVRGTVTGVIAVVVAVGSAVALSALGPFGVAGRAEVDAGIVVVDGMVLLLGSALTIMVVAGATWWPVARDFGRPARRQRISRRSGIGVVPAHLPASATAGLSMSFSRRGAGGLPVGAALAGVALAFTTALAAVGLTASLDSLTSTSAHFGAPWDLSAGSAVGSDASSDLVELLGRDPDVEAAAGIVGSDAEIGDEVAWFQAFQPVDGVDGLIGPVITAGRAPAAIDEVALGSTTMADQGLAIGDSIDLRPVTSAGVTSRMTVVGTTIINDSFENNPGRGGVVTVEWVDEYVEESSPDPFVIRLRSGADLARFRAELDEVATAGVSAPVVQGAIRNVDRVRFVPFLLAALVGLLAVASLAHALVLSVRRQRGHLAVLKSLGFRRGQVRAAVAWHASALVLVAAVIGVPLGIIAGRWGWRLIADELGVASAPTTPLLWLVLIIVGFVAIANLIAAFPAWAAARVSTAHALRVE